MPRHFHEELEQVKEKTLKLGSLVETMVENAVSSLVDRDSRLADQTIESDRIVDSLEVEINEDCIRLLALQQPAAKDLRFITTAMKITTDLERTADQAVNICERAIELNEGPQLKPYIDIPIMSQLAQKMMREALDAFVQRDPELARRVIPEDNKVDALKDQIFRELLTFMMEDPRTIPRAICLILVSRHLERIADHATNVAEMVVFLVEGKNIRHAASPNG
ncbi:MAG TPA: phosphate signaling complex protein PhoU [Candidatus Acidoferrum sp.]|nr:phosphate signaling complex protein PhoU [Candidatus Methylomirabilis sp.]HWU36567.1 phosphate signaling complex protein PhoU [Candidatus Acidoferrum sp.]